MNIAMMCCNVQTGTAVISFIWGLLSLLVLLVTVFLGCRLDSMLLLRRKTAASGTEDKIGPARKRFLAWIALSFLWTGYWFFSYGPEYLGTLFG